MSKRAKAKYTTTQKQLKDNSLAFDKKNQPAIFLQVGLIFQKLQKPRAGFN